MAERDKFREVTIPPVSARPRQENEPDMRNTTKHTTTETSLPSVGP